MISKDLRDYVDNLEKTGDLVKIKEEVDWDLEVGATVCLSGERGKPAPFFEKIKDYPGCRMVGRVPYGRRRIAIALGLDPESPWPKIKKETEDRCKFPLKPILVKDGPCKENIFTGDKVDIFRLPAPMLADGDGARYMGTLCIVIIKDPDSDWINWGTYRMMVHDEKHMGVYFHRQNQGGVLFYDKFEPRNKAMPMAVIVGGDPLHHIAAAMPFGVGESEVDFAGALKKNPVELVKAETIDLPVPANAEIVLEGEVLPGVRLPEGPFMEWTRHQSTFTSSPVFRLKAITHRNNPIITLGVGPLTNDEVPMVTVEREMRARKFLLERGIPVTELHCPEPMRGATWVVAVKRTEEANIAQRVEHCLKALQSGLPVWTVVVDEDVDVYNLTEVLHALVVRCHPGKGITINKNEVANRLLPYLSMEEKKYLKGASVLFDCTWPREWQKENIPIRGTFREAYPEDVKQRVLSNWKKFGYT